MTSGKLGKEKTEVAFRLVFKPAKRSVERDIVLVTGTGHGIGREIALAFGRLGAKIVVWDINKENNQATADQIVNTGGEAWAYECDVTDPEAVRRVGELVRNDVGDITILVNNAGIFHGGALLDLKDSDIEKTFAVNTLAHYWTVREFLPAMLKNNYGHVVTIASLAAKFGFAYMTDYSSSKWAVFGFTESIRDELRRMGKPGVKTTIFCLNFVDTGLAKFPKLGKFERILSPEETASAVVDGVRRQEEVIYVPKFKEILLNVLKLLPRKAHHLLFEFMDLGVEPQYRPRGNKKTE